MKKILAFAGAAILSLVTVASQAQSREIKAGHVYYITLPDYMTRTVGINNVASLQFKSDEKDAYGLIIEDSKEELDLAEIKFSGVMEFYQDFIKDFVVEEDQRQVGSPVSTKIGEVSFVENDVTYYDTQAKAVIYYFVGMAETGTTYYKVLCFTDAANKDALKADFRKILYSLRD